MTSTTLKKRRLRSVGVALAAVGFTLPSCAGDLDEPLGAASQPAAGLDDHVGAESVSEEIHMTAGRAARLPLSRVFHGQRTVTGAHTMRVRARCVSATASADGCDPGMLVVANTGGIRDVIYSNNSPSAGGNGKGAYVQEMAPSTTTYDVIVYSHLLRATSHVMVEHSLNGVVWETGGFIDPTTGESITDATQIVGGTLVGLGDVSGGDNIGTRTPDDGAGAQSGTRLYVFDQEHEKFAFVDGPTTGDRDPVLPFDSSWTKAYVIAAKDELLPAAGPRGIEAFVDLVAGPIGAETLVGPDDPTDCVGTTSANSTSRMTCTMAATTLLPGRYNVYVYANSNGRGVGRVVSGGSFPASDTGDSTCGSRPRGRANDLAFTAQLLRDGQVVETRPIPRGAIGSEGYDDASDPTDTPWDRFAFEVRVPDDGVAHSYSVRAVQNAVRVRARWGYARNPEDVEMKVVTLNIEPHADDAQTDAMMKNTADLLGTRVEYTSSGMILDAPNRGQWQWASDVIAMQEIKGIGPTVEMQNRLTARTGLSWSRMLALGTWKDAQWPLPNYESFAPVIASEQVTPAGGIWFSNATMNAAGCTSMADYSQASAACFLSYQEDGDLTWSEYHYLVPVKTEAKRVKGSGGGYQTRPVAIMNWYLNDSDSDVRRAGVDEAINKIKKLITADPDAFNVDGNPSARWRGNRFVILGDSNMYNQQCSEVNETLVKLRNEFGYAVDVSMAQMDAYNRTMDMHYSGAPITDLQQGVYGDCENSSWAKIPGSWSGEPTGCPYHFKSIDSWKADVSSPIASDPTIEAGDKYAVDPSQWYTWWGGTSSGGHGSSRHDVILLVGRGWAYDDPVKRYSTTSDTSFRSFINDYVGGGVEILSPGDPDIFGVDLDCDYSGIPDLVTTPGSYSPNFALTGQSLGEGKPTLCTDHKPVGARLRLTFAR
jgi:hypothetical protein